MEGKGKMLEWTGERYLPFVNPEISGAEIHYEHLHRFAFAVPPKLRSKGGEIQ